MPTKSNAPAANRRGEGLGSSLGSLHLSSTPGNDNARAPLGIVVQLVLAPDAQELVQDLVRAAMADVLAAQAPVAEYRDSTAEARRLNISRAGLDRLAREGCPLVYVGDQRRYRASDVDQWLDARTAERAGAR